MTIQCGHLPVTGTADENGYFYVNTLVFDGPTLHELPCIVFEGNEVVAREVVKACKDFDEQRWCLASDHFPEFECSHLRVLDGGKYVIIDVT